jgi:hypothetical protein
MTGKSRPVRGPRKPLEGCHIISEFDVPIGQPLGPHAQKYVSHYGYLVRDGYRSVLKNGKRSQVLHTSVLSLIVIRRKYGLTSESISRSTRTMRS